MTNVLVASPGGTGVTLDGVGGFWGYNLHSYHSGGFGFYIYDSDTSDENPSENMFFTACTGDTSGFPNWAVVTVRRLSLDHCWAASNISNTQNTWASGFYFGGTVGANGYSSVTDVVMTACWAVQNNKNGIEIADSQQVAVSNCEVLGNSVGQGNAEEGIVIRGKSSNVRLIGNRSRDDHLELKVPSPKTQLAGIGVREQSDSIVAIGNDVQGNIAAIGINDSAVATTKRLYRGNLGYNPLVVVPQPALPASGVAVQNTSSVDCTVFLAGGTVTSVAIGGVVTGITASNTSYRVSAGSSITVSYSTAPTWRWIGE